MANRPAFCIGAHCFTRSGCIASGICDKARGRVDVAIPMRPHHKSMRPPKPLILFDHGMWYAMATSSDTSYEHLCAAAKFVRYLRNERGGHFTSAWLSSWLLHR